MARATRCSTTLSSAEVASSLDDVDIREFASLHARMALVSQEVWLLNRTLRDNLTFGLERTVPDRELFAALGVRQSQSPFQRQ